MAILSQTKDTRYAERAAAPSRYPESYVKEAWGRYVAEGGETSISAGDLLGDRISWSSANVRQLRVIRGVGGEQIHRLPDTGSGWGVDALNPPTIQFSTPLVADEIVDVVVVNRLSSIITPQEQSFYTHKFADVPAASTQSTFILPRPIKLTRLNGVNRGQTYILIADGKVVTEGEDYTENQIAGTDLFGSVTFTDPVGDPFRAIGVVLISFGFYADDNISQYVLNNLSETLEASFENTVILRDEKPQNTAGGTFTAGADQVRDLNTILPAARSWVSLAANQFTLQSGRYLIEWSCPAYNVERHQSMLYSASDIAVVKRGAQLYARAGGSNVENVSTGSHLIHLTASKIFEIRHRCEATQAADGFGVLGNFGTEVYTQVKIFRYP